MTAFLTRPDGGSPVPVEHVLDDLARLYRWANRMAAYTQALEDRIARLENPDDQ